MVVTEHDSHADVSILNEIENMVSYESDSDNGLGKMPVTTPIQQIRLDVISQNRQGLRSAQSVKTEDKWWVSAYNEPEEVIVNRIIHSSTSSVHPTC